ncbi:methylated-DNA--[protein]-cysteine S-methyltransferase [Comamonas badia]|uniref:methylated-DNA--[protein]-cysteine S-methyltransferase n=1 Tax=Comamonas badia TaxID=265291 RepID=UPI0004A37A45|nr:methylated-DNA--[protein]-cysteine S-methyltransferase [Comamonas badia]
MSLISHTYSTPLGEMTALLSPKGLCLLEFTERTKGLAREIAQVEAARGGPPVPGENAFTRQLGKELAQYFAGKRNQFDIPLDLVGTAFQQTVWRALLTIPHGQTRSYGEQARQIGKPTATRAVAAANGANKIALIVPCHRVIGSDGSLTGYGGGVPRKEWLLTLERSA